MVKDIKDLSKDMFETMSDEAVAVYSPVPLNHMIREPGSLESLLKVLRDLNPCVMVIIEADADHNSPDFFCRFNDALLSCTAYFECLEVCTDESDPNRLRMEDTYLSKQISNIVAMEGEERIFWRLKIEGWRTFFGGFGMVEQELSMSSLYQAELMVKNFACGSSCTLERNGNCLTIGWKGRSFLSVSAWRFHQEQA
ncbi:DELLA protein 1-like [Corylus avellana]|uniref:DELLA protein 1-like n=1 Tax=Corylus avellana TaxID=13451 RepID=UPI002869FC4F|nr:DELLA protein 1-like [Corylus avellana]